MIHIDLTKLILSPKWGRRAQKLTRELETLQPDKRSAFIDSKDSLTWRNREVLEALRKIVGNKCWYSEVYLEGADPNVDHFRPKGEVQEVDSTSFQYTGKSGGYWWLAFECQNFRLSSQHANQRRVNSSTTGGKSNYFPVRGNRAPERTPWVNIVEDNLALDPCSARDISLLWFDSNGVPSYSNLGQSNAQEQDRVRITIWLYHLNKPEIQARRRQHIQQIYADLLQANVQYKIWNRDSESPDLQAKSNFDYQVIQISAKLVDTSEFAGAKRCAVRTAVANYEWIDEFILF